MDVQYYFPRPSEFLANIPDGFSVLTSTQLNVLTAVLSIVVPTITLLYLHYDYQRFISLGPGGTPSTPLGYAKIKLLSFFSLRDVLRPIYIPAHFRPQRGYLSSLPKRDGRRPIVRGIAPQRQQTQRAPAAIYAKLVEGMRSLAKEPRNRLIERTSCFEKHSSGLFSSTPITRTCGGEICHGHPSDGSMHLVLHPADGRILLESGWGERHPLAKGGWFRRFVPKEFVLVYAPRNEAEVEVAMRAIAASVWWVSGIDVNNQDLNKRGSDEGVDEEALKKVMEENECWTCKLHSKDKMIEVA